MTWRDEARNTTLGSKRNVMKWAENRPVRDGGKDFTKPWAWQGYVGYSCGQVSIGERLDGTIVKLVGKAADDWMRAGLPGGHNVTRIDIALTIWGVSDRSAEIALHSEQTELYRKGLEGKPYKVRLIDGKGDGDTLYIGSRSSQQFVRIYDKEKSPNATKEHETSIRYECECKEQLAYDCYQRCVARGYGPASCLSLLASLLDRRGIDVVLLRGLQRKPIAPSELPVTSLESSLSWLENQVKPTVSRLMREGYELEILTALGLKRYFNTGY
jgi:hypothetical protein